MTFDNQVFFDVPEDWELVSQVSRQATNQGENSFTRIPDITFGLFDNVRYLAVVAGTEDDEPTWRFAGDIAQVFGFSPGQGTSTQNTISTRTTPLVIDRLQIIQADQISPDPYRLRYRPPRWFRQANIRVWAYRGEVLNLAADQLTGVAQALGVTENPDQPPMDDRLTDLEDLLFRFIQEVDERLTINAEFNEVFRDELRQQISQIDAGLFTAIDGIALSLPSANADELRNQAINRLDLDLGFL